MEENIKTKSKTRAGLLAIFLGFLGVHNFYLGYRTKGIIQMSIGGLFLALGNLGIVVGIAIFVFSLLMIIGTLGIGLAIWGPMLFVGFVDVLFYLGCIPTMIWGWVEAILIFSGKIKTDANGVLLK